MSLRRSLPVVVCAAILLLSVAPVGRAFAQDATSSVLAERAELDKALAADTEPRIPLLQKFLVNHPQSLLADQAREALVRTLATVGEKALKAGDPAAAAVAFRKALDAAGDKISDRMFSQVIWQMPVVMASAGYRNDAVELMHSFEPKFAAQAPRLIQIGFFYVQIESPPDAIRVLQRAVELAPNDYRAHNSLGTAYILALRLDDAAAEYQRAIEIEPRAEFAYTSLANLRRAFGNSTDAIELYKKQLDVTPDSPETFGGLSVAYLLTDDDAAATNAFGRALALSPRDFRLFTTLGYLYASKGRYDKAREMIDLSMRYEPRFAWSYIVTGNILLGQKRYNEAIDALNQGTGFGDFPTLHFELAKAYMVNDQFTQAVDQLQAAFDITDDGQFETRLGDILDLRSSKLDLLLERERQAVLYLPVQPTTPTQYRLAESLARINHFLRLIPDPVQPAAPAGQPAVTDTRPLNLPSAQPVPSAQPPVTEPAPAPVTTPPVDEPVSAPPVETPLELPSSQPSTQPAAEQPPAEQPPAEQPPADQPIAAPEQTPADQPQDQPQAQPLDLPPAEPPARDNPQTDTLKLDLPDDPAAKPPESTPPPVSIRSAGAAPLLPFVRVVARVRTEPIAAQSSASQDSGEKVIVTDPHQTPGDAPLVYRPRRSTTPAPAPAPVTASVPASEPAHTTPQPEPQPEPQPSAPSTSLPVDSGAQSAPLSPLDPSVAKTPVSSPSTATEPPPAEPTPISTPHIEPAPVSAEPAATMTSASDIVPQQKVEPVVEAKSGPNGREVDPAFREQLSAAIDAFVGVDDGREAFRKMWVAHALADKGVMLDRALELAQQALAAVDTATELDKSVRDMPDADRATRQAVLTARAEDVLGWVLLKRGDTAGAIAQLTNSANAGVKDNDASTRLWHLGVAKQEIGNDQEALDLYVKAFDPASPSAPIRKRIIEILYVKLYGSTAGLDQRLARP